MNFLVVGLGACLGGMLRYLFLSLFTTEFPFSTLLSNVLAGFLMGFAIGIARSSGGISQNMRLFITTGFLGGLSTFSGLSLDTVVMFEQQKYVLGSFNILVNVSLSLFFLIIGLWLGNIVVNTIK